MIPVNKTPFIKPNLQLNLSEISIFNLHSVRNKTVATLLPKLPTVLLSRIGSYCEMKDVPSLSRVNKLFAQIFSGKQEAGRPAAQVLLEQVKGSRTITSVKMLGQQLKGLQRYCPHYLGEVRPWTMAEMIKLMLPSLKVIDLSKEKMDTRELKEFLDIFDEVAKTCAPLETKTGKSIEVKYGELTVLQALSDEQQIVLGDKLAPGLLDLINGAEIAENQDQLIKALKEATDITHAKFNELKKTPYAFLALLQELFPDIPFEVTSTEVEQEIFGDIKIIKFGAIHFAADLATVDAKEKFSQDIKRDFNRLLKSFCPNLSHLTLFAPIIDLSFIKDNFLHSIVHIDQGQAFAHHMQSTVPFELNSSKLEYLSTSAFESPRTFRARAEACPNIKNAQIGAFDHDANDVLINAIHKQAENCPHIQTLEFYMGYSNLEDEKELFEALKKFKNLRELKISGQIEGRGGLLSLLAHMRNLTRLDLDVSWFNMDKTLAFLPGLVPNLEELTITDVNIPARFFTVLMQLPKLKEFIIRNPPFYVKLEEEYVTLRSTILSLRSLSSKLKEEDCPGRELFEALQKLPPNVLHDIYYYTWVHCGMPNIPHFGKKSLEQDIGILRILSKPFVSLKGANLLEQLAWREYEKSITFDVQYKYLNPLEKGEIRRLMIRASFETSEKVRYALWERHGKEGDGDKYLQDLFEPGRNREDLNLALSIIEPDIAELREEHAENIKPYYRARLEAFSVLLQDKEISQPQLLALFKSLDKDLRDKLSFALWEESGRPQEEGFAGKRIETDVRSLQDVVARMIISLPFYYVPDPKKSEADILKEFLSFINNETLSQRQLMTVFTALDPRLQERLKYQLWIAHNKPDIFEFSHGMISNDVRCLKKIF